MKKLTHTLAPRTIHATSLFVLGLMAACGGGSSGNDEQDPPRPPQPGDCPPALDQQGGAWTIVGATYQLDEDQAGLEDPLFPVDLGLQSRQLNLARLDLQDIADAYVDMYGVSQCADGKPGASLCITLYAAGGTGMGTASTTGVMPSTLMALAFAGEAPLVWPVSPVLIGSYYDAGLGMTVQLDGVSWVERVGDTVTQTIQYKTYPGDIMVALPDHVVGEDDDCDGLIDEADELLPVDMLDPTVPAIHAGQVVLVMQRGSALVEDLGDDDARLAAVAESPMLGLDGQVAGVARVLQLAGEPTLRLTMDDPLNPGFELALGLPVDEDGRFAAVVSARGARYALRGVRTGPVGLEGELVLLDAERAQAWTIGGGLDVDD
ncbi:MAG: hypothetical protein RL112_973 [Planctomycetota bacterium]